MPTASIQISYTLSTIESAVHQFWQYAHRYNVLAFSGEMGAGKTTFIHALCNLLEVSDRVSSPTFALINEYHFDDDGKDHTIYHMDWYRIKSAEEAMEAGIEDCLLRKESYSFVEWPEKAPELLPHPHLWITIAPTEHTDERTITISIIE